MSRRTGSSSAAGRHPGEPGEKKFKRTDEDKNFYYIERSYGTFQLPFRLPGTVDPDQVQARLEHGVLTVTVPKNEQQERSRRIKI
ncbi:MAG: Hsp20/alpha crystallin family protein [Microvirga sp.]